LDGRSRKGAKDAKQIMALSTPADIEKDKSDSPGEAGTDSSLGPRTSELGPFLSLMSEIEQELRRRGQWEPIPPSPKAFESRLPFCCDSMRFTQWLQWVFIPHTRALAEAGGPMPEVSGIRLMAEEALQDCDWKTIPLMVLLDRFDRMINA
jgi:uncharacterized protein YqcC (DUF446 family)